MTRTSGGQTVCVVVRLRGQGVVRLTTLGGGVHAWRVRLTSEDALFAEDPLPPVVSPDGAGLRIAFERPAAVILEQA
ncbi:MAG: hypothetical protein IT180_14105 [Acidobacteria bacterium]|nr:hypothetical protein [Acidobacteriota bacterium]